MTLPTADDHPFRFYDNREKYLLFVTTTNEKDMTARRIGEELVHLKPQPPSIRLFDAGMGDATVLNSVLEQLHHLYPTTPFVVVGKEISLEDTRMSLAKLHTRFAEHPETVVLVTNMYYREAPWLEPLKAEDVERVQWWDIPLEGTTSHEFGIQLRDLGDIIAKGWKTVSSEKTGNPLYVTPSVVVLYRQDHAFALDHAIPKQGERYGNYDLVIAAQPYRAKTGVDFKVDKVLAPLAESLRSGGRMVVVQGTGHDPGMEIIRKVWPDEDPFRTPRHLLARELERRLGDEFSIHGDGDEDALFTYSMHALPDDMGSNIGTSMLLAAWNAAVYVAQIDDDRVNRVLRSADYLEAAEAVLQRHGGLWFQDESFVVTRD